MCEQYTKAIEIIVNKLITTYHNFFRYIVDKLRRFVYIKNIPTTYRSFVGGDNQ